jgi:hypothetical protein
MSLIMYRFDIFKNCLDTELFILVDAFFCAYLIQNNILMKRYFHTIGCFISHMRILRSTKIKTEHIISAPSSGFQNFICRFLIFLFFIWYGILDFGLDQLRNLNRITQVDLTLFFICKTVVPINACAFYDKIFLYIVPYHLKYQNIYTVIIAWFGTFPLFLLTHCTQ